MILFLLERFSDHSVENGLAGGSLEIGQVGRLLSNSGSLEYIPSTRCKPGAVVGIGDTVVNEADVIPSCNEILKNNGRK